MLMKLEILILLMSLTQTQSTLVQGTRIVALLGFDNHSNQSVATLVQIPVNSVVNRLDRKTALDTHIARNQELHSSM